MRLAQPICFTIMRQVRLAATAILFHFLRNMRNGHLRMPTGAVAVGEAEDGERMNHVDRNHMASMDYVCQHSTLFTRLPCLEVEEPIQYRLHVIEALPTRLTIKQDRRVLSSVPRLVQRPDDRMQARERRSRHVRLCLCFSLQPIFRSRSSSPPRQ